MSLSTTLATVSSLTTNPTSAQNQINNNFTAVNVALANGLALNGFAPNQMQANLDMNSFQILNLPAPTTATSPLRVSDANQLGTGGTIVALPVGIVAGTTGLGYGAGSGSSVAQATSRTTGVTINTPTGSITMFSAAGSATAASFTVTNSSVGINDTIRVVQRNGTNLYNLLVTAVAAGSFQITFFTTGGTATDAPVLNYTVMKGSVT